MLQASSTLARVQGFERGLRVRAARRVATHDFGTAIFCGDIPQVWDLNVAFLDVELERGDTDALIAEVEGLQSEARLPHRRVLVSHEETAERLLPRFTERGWTHSWWVYMVHDGVREELAWPNAAQEVDQPTARAVEAQVLAEGEFIRDEGTLAQMLAGRDRLSENTAARFFVGTREDTPVSVCTLYSDGAIAQVEDVATLESHRGLGRGRAVVEAALAAALAAAHEVVFVVADDGDWPKHLYRRLGFEPVGRALNLVRQTARAQPAV